MRRRLHPVLRALPALMSLPLAIACGSPSKTPQGPVVLAAASLQEALQDAAKAWAAHGHPVPVLSFAGSAALARQVEQGAPADVFVSADEDWADTLQREKLLRAGSRADLLTNALVLVGPKGGKVRSLSALDGGKLALADPASVPAGKYAKATLQKLGEWPKVAADVVPAENVRAALALVEKGEAALGIVYATDARASGKVDVLATFPESSHPPIRYPVALLSSSRNPDAEAFRQFLFTPEAGRIFAAHGFGLAQPPAR